MVEFLYEKDLRGMQFNILESTRHQWVIAELATRYGVRKPEIRRRMIERMDMILLENLPARYEVWRDQGDGNDPIDRELGVELLTVYIPLVDDARMQNIAQDTRERILENNDPEKAIAEGLARIREMIRS
jgi:energy-converting hydrogenase A subunit M